MQNFIYKNATEIVFGKGMIKEIARRVPADKTVLFLYGGGSIKKNGVHAQVMEVLKGRDIVEFGGIEPNPQLETCLKALDLVRQHGVGFILSVGGGSVIDAGKFIAAAACFPGKDPWEMILHKGANIAAALPLGVVVTLPATGSESNGNAVISRRDRQEKRILVSPHVYPCFAILDPEVTMTVPLKQVRNGIVDAFTHVLEQYVTYPAAAPLQDRLAEALLKTLIEVGPVTLKDPSDYDARATFMWSATLALNYLIGAGVPQDWSTHRIGVEITAFYGLDHAETLAVILPGVWQYKFKDKEEKLRQFGQRVWQVDSAREAMDRTEDFFRLMGMKTRLAEYGISPEEAARKVRERFSERQVVYGERNDITPEAVEKIILMRG
ncbi:MAG: iron-containing alcohol dehydrogenase [Candidatus Omnitrophota bacterium]